LIFISLILLFFHHRWRNYINNKEQICLITTIALNTLVTMTMTSGLENSKNGVSYFHNVNFLFPDLRRHDLLTL